MLTIIMNAKHGQAVSSCLSFRQRKQAKDEISTICSEILYVTAAAVDLDNNERLEALLNLNTFLKEYFSNFNGPFPAIPTAARFQAQVCLKMGTYQRIYICHVLTAEMGW